MNRGPARQFSPMGRHGPAANTVRASLRRLTENHHARLRPAHALISAHKHASRTPHRQMAPP